MMMEVNAMKRIFSITILFSIFLVSCNKAQNGNAKITSDAYTSQLNPGMRYIDSIWDNISSIPSTLEGYKPLMIVGDWDGTGRKDTLYECYYSRKLKREVVSPLILYRDNDSITYDDLVALTIELEPAIYIINKSYPMDTISIDAHHQLFGFYFLENKGDLNGDGKDELLYMVDYADWSSTNTYNIYSRRKGKWGELYSFPVWEWQFEDGDKNIIEKLPDNKIKITFRNDEAMEETKIVDLNKIK